MLQLWHHYLEYFYGNCIVKSSGNSFFIARSIDNAYIALLVTGEAMF